VMRKLVRDAGLEQSFEIDSAGTGGWHVGDPPDERAIAAARNRGIALEGHARKVGPEDFERFDLIAAMDSANERDLRRLAPGDEARAKVRLLREFDPGSAGLVDLDVPDPYYDSDRGFEIVLDQVQAACEGLLEYARESRPA
jgi:protein-tyrosine phosphatase